MAEIPSSLVAWVCTLFRHDLTHSNNLKADLRSPLLMQPLLFNFKEGFSTNHQTCDWILPYPRPSSGPLWAKSFHAPEILNSPVWIKFSFWPILPFSFISYLSTYSSKQHISQHFQNIPCLSKLHVLYLLPGRSFQTLTSRQTFSLSSKRQSLHYGAFPTLSGQFSAARSLCSLEVFLI